MSPFDMNIMNQQNVILFIQSQSSPSVRGVGEGSLALTLGPNRFSYVSLIQFFFHSEVRLDIGLDQVADIVNDICSHFDIFHISVFSFVRDHFKMS